MLRGKLESQTMAFPGVLLGAVWVSMMAFNELVLSLLWSSVSWQRGQDVGGKHSQRAGARQYSSLQHDHSLKRVDKK